VSSYTEPELVQDSNVEWVRISVDNLLSALLQEVRFSQMSSNWLRIHSKNFDIIKVNGAITDFESDINAVHFLHSSWLSSPYNLSRLFWRQLSFRYLYQFLYTALNSYWEKKAFAKAKKVVAVSQQVQQELIAIGVPKEKIHVIFNGVDLEEFSPSAVNRRNWGLPTDRIIALFAGDIKTSRKNLESVLYALRNVPSLGLAVLGSTEGSIYPQLASDLEISDRTYFMGYRKDISDIMKAVDFFVFPSRYEPYGLVILEALASGLPVITAATVGASNLVTPRCGVVLQDPDNIEELSHAMQKIGTDEFLRLSMSQSARTVAEKHSWSAMSETYLKLAHGIV
jgi:glycosyltransferase involved in cell wall biosynthesis